MSDVVSQSLRDITRTKTRKTDVVGTLDCSRLSPTPTFHYSSFLNGSYGTQR